MEIDNSQTDLVVPKASNRRGGSQFEGISLKEKKDPTLLGAVKYYTISSIFLEIKWHWSLNDKNN